MQSEYANPNRVNSDFGRIFNTILWNFDQEFINQVASLSNLRLSVSEKYLLNRPRVECLSLLEIHLLKNENYLNETITM